MKAFITGVGGFVGQHLADLLLSKNFEVYGSYHTNKPSLKNVRLFQVDISQRQKLEKAILQVKPDYVFHLAAISSVKRSWEGPELTRKINVFGTDNLLSSIESSGPSAKTLIVSSSEVYGEPRTIPITEDHALNPLNPYSKSKLECEQLCKKYDLPYVITRSFTHIGPGQSPIFFCSEFAKTVAEIEKGLQERVLTFGDASVVRDVTDVRDIAKAYLLCLDKGKPREIYNICSGKGISIRKILDLLTSFSTKEITLQQDKSKLVGKSITTMIGDYQKFSKVSGWKPRIQISQTLKDMLDYWRSRI